MLLSVDGLVETGPQPVPAAHSHNRPGRQRLMTGVARQKALATFFLPRHVPRASAQPRVPSRHGLELHPTVHGKLHFKEVLPSKAWPEEGVPRVIDSAHAYVHVANDKLSSQMKPPPSGTSHLADSLPPSVMAKEILEQCGVCLVAGNVDQAEALFATLDELPLTDPSLAAEASLARGLFFERSKCDLAQALALYEKALQFAPDSTRALCSIGRVHGCMGDVKTARQYYETAMFSTAKGVPCAEAMVALAATYDHGRATENDLERASSLFAQALSTMKEGSIEAIPALNAWADMRLGRQGDFLGALQLLECAAQAALMSESAVHIASTCSTLAQLLCVKAKAVRQSQQNQTSLGIAGTDAGSRGWTTARVSMLPRRHHKANPGSGKSAEFQSPEAMLARAITLYDCAREADPSSVDVCIGLAKACLLLDKVGRAEVLCREALSLQPENITARALLGRVLSLNPSFAHESEIHLQTVIDRRDVDLELQRECLLALGWLYVHARQKLRTAEYIFAQLTTKKYRGEQLGNDVTAKILCGLAVSMMLSRSDVEGMLPADALAEVLSIFRRAIHMSTGRDAVAIAWLGWVLAHHGERSEAEKLFSDALVVDPHSSVALLGFARCLRAKGDSKGALVLLIRLLCPIGSRSLLPLAAFGRRAGAASSGAVVIGGSCDPTLRCEALAEYALLLLDVSTPKTTSVRAANSNAVGADAQRDRRGALPKQGVPLTKHRDFAMTPSTPMTASSVDCFNDLARRIVEAERAAVAALRIEPTNVNAIYALGSVHAHAGHSGDAERCFRHVLRIYPGHLPATCGLVVLMDARCHGDHHCKVDKLNETQPSSTVWRCKALGDRLFMQALVLAPSWINAWRYLAPLLNSHDLKRNSDRRRTAVVAMQRATQQLRCDESGIGEPSFGNVNENGRSEPALSRFKLASDNVAQLLATLASGGDVDVDA